MQLTRKRAGEPDGERANGRLRLVQFGDDAHAAFEVARSGVGQCQPAGRADQKLRLEPVLKLLHPFGDHGFGHAKPARGGDEAAALDDADEHANSGQLVHGLIVRDLRTIRFQIRRLSNISA